MIPKTHPAVDHQSILKKTSIYKDKAAEISIDKHVRFVSSYNEPQNCKRERNLNRNMGLEYPKLVNCKLNRIQSKDSLAQHNVERMELSQFRLFLMKQCKQSGRKYLASFNNSSFQFKTEIEKTINDSETVNQNGRSQLQNIKQATSTEKMIILDAFKRSLTSYPDTKEKNLILNSIFRDPLSTSTLSMLELITNVMLNNTRFLSSENCSKIDKPPKGFNSHIIPPDLFISEEKSRKDNSNIDLVETITVVGVESEIDDESKNNGLDEHHQNSKKLSKPTKKNYIFEELDYQMSRIAGNRGITLFQNYMNELYSNLEEDLVYVWESIRKIGSDSDNKIPCLKYVFSIREKVDLMYSNNKKMFQKANKTLSMKTHLEKLHAELKTLKLKLDQMDELHSSIRETLRQEIYYTILYPYEQLKKGLEVMLQILKCNIKYFKLEEHQKLCMKPKKAIASKRNNESVNNLDIQIPKTLKLVKKSSNLVREMNCKALKNKLKNHLELMECSIVDRSSYIDELKMKIYDVNRKLQGFELFCNDLVNMRL